MQGSSRAPADRKSIDIALVPEIAALDEGTTRAWMTAQGYGPDTPDEVMYLTDEPVPGGFESLRLAVTPAEAAAWRAAADEQDDLTAVCRDGNDREAALREMRLYRKITGGRDETVRAAAAAGINIRRIHLETGLSRATIYKILGETPQRKPRRPPPRRQAV